MSSEEDVILKAQWLLNSTIAERQEAGIWPEDVIVEMLELLESSPQPSEELQLADDATFSSIDDLVAAIYVYARKAQMTKAKFSEMVGTPIEAILKSMPGWSHQSKRSLSTARTKFNAEHYQQYRSRGI